MGQIFNERWEVIESLSEGGQAHTFVVNDRTGSADIRYVLKRLKNTKRLGRFQTEIDTIRSINSPYVIRILDFQTEGEKPFYVTDYYVDGTLAEVTDVFAEDVLLALKIFKNICKGIMAAHEQGIIHRDIKPENILFIRAENRPVVADFGLAYIENDARHTLLEEVVGPRFFIAPEMEDGRSDLVTPATDIYSLGKLLYWMLSGGKKFSREQHREVNFNLENINSRFSHVNAVLDRCIAHAPSARFTSVQELIKAIDQILIALQGYFNAPELDAPKLCRNCGRGYYRLIVNDNHNDAKTFGFTPYGGSQWLIYVCDQCANVSIFRPDLMRKRRR
ncbi:serine/threonine protein kinase [Deinococcus cellulosilyticus]|uniref:Protein kinase domain-containing protein n=1 Tax=Deinococcus cellulosilyticus (strain DSM 18568 / NBRC 106333 / KACC 11606 / 5516J-15) TaxID=1223518 RepID=A0A511NC88_DEIC1|nr:serine/threonine-protein kinase [Deinococcus cellulosilyticus]GEM50118.1 hypothetical protein DC3_57530 [Deinococcus cellulosilyticus NBRC 106333 = KACC 11606]